MRHIYVCRVFQGQFVDEIRHRNSTGNFIESCICDNWSKIAIVRISFLESSSNHYLEEISVE